MAEIYGDRGMSGSPILGNSCDVQTDGADADGDVVGILRGCVGEHILRITFITGEVIYSAAEQT